MKWQDWVLGAGNFSFVIALVPSIIGKDKPALASSISTAIVLYIFAATFMSLELWLSSISALTVGATWTILAIQKYRINKNTKPAAQ